MGVSGSEMQKDGMRIAYADFNVLDIRCVEMHEWLRKVHSVPEHIPFDINPTTYLKGTRERLLDLVICIIQQITQYKDEVSIPHYINLLHMGIQLDKNIVFNKHHASRTWTVGGH